MNKEEIIANAIGRFQLRRKKVCFGCGKKCDEGRMTQFVDGDEESMFCPTCAFVMGLYIQSGIRTTFAQNSLRLDIINSQFRKQALEFEQDPRAAEEKYLKAFREKLKQESRIKITDKKIRLFDNFPFIFLNDEEYQLHKPAIGKEFTLYGKTMELKRRVYFMLRMPAEACEKYGRSGDNWVLYLPEDFEE